MGDTGRPRYPSRIAANTHELCDQDSEARRRSPTVPTMASSQTFSLKTSLLRLNMEVPTQAVHLKQDLHSQLHAAKNHWHSNRLDETRLPPVATPNDMMQCTIQHCPNFQTTGTLLAHSSRFLRQYCAVILRARHPKLIIAALPPKHFTYYLTSRPVKYRR